MTSSVNYPTPVTVNGYSCKNCTDVDYAKKHVDPAHPKDGPYGIDKTDKAGKPEKTGQSPAVTFGGRVAELAAASGATTGANGVSGVAPAPPTPSVGTLLNISA